MSVARISIMRALPIRSPGYDKKPALEHLLDELEEHLSNQPGYIMGFRFAGHQNEREVGRIALWKSRLEADHAATLEYTIALRSQVHLLIEPGPTETVVEIKGTLKNNTQPHRTWSHGNHGTAG